jgi:hypothetical protein
MDPRQVIATGKDKDGDITKLCNHAQYWSPRPKRDAIDDIDNRGIKYVVVWPDGKITPVTVVNGANGKYLRTLRDGSSRNNLADLPDC